MYDSVAAICSHDAEKLGLRFTEECVYEDMALGEVMRGRESVKAGTVISSQLFLTSKWRHYHFSSRVTGLAASG